MCSDSLFAAGFSTFWHAELEAQKKRIAETPENGDNGEGGVLALPSEQVDENHVAAQQSGASESQDPHVVAEQTQTSEQAEESHVEVRQFGQHSQVTMHRHVRTVYAYFMTRYFQKMKRKETYFSKQSRYSCI